MLGMRWIAMLSVGLNIQALWWTYDIGNAPGYSGSPKSCGRLCRPSRKNRLWAMTATDTPWHIALRVARDMQKLPRYCSRWGYFRWAMDTVRHFRWCRVLITLQVEPWRPAGCVASLVALSEWEPEPKSWENWCTQYPFHNMLVQLINILQWWKDCLDGSN